MALSYKLKTENQHIPTIAAMKFGGTWSFELLCLPISNVIMILFCCFWQLNHLPFLTLYSWFQSSFSVAIVTQHSLPLVIIQLIIDNPHICSFTNVWNKIHIFYLPLHITTNSITLKYPETFSNIYIYNIKTKYIYATWPVNIPINN